MAITRAQKEVIIASTKEAFQKSKLTLIVKYQGTAVSQFQTVRSQLEKSDVTIKVIKNRLVRQALTDLKFLKDEIELDGMLAYVFSFEDEVKGAQILKKLTKTSAIPLEFVGAITESGHFMSREEVIKLAGLASKPELIGLTLNSLRTPVWQIQAGLQSGIFGILNGLKEHKA